MEDNGENGRGSADHPRGWADWMWQSHPRLVLEANADRARNHMGVRGVHMGVHRGEHTRVHRVMHTGVHRGVHMRVHMGAHMGVHRGVHRGVQMEVQFEIHMGVQLEGQVDVLLTCQSDRHMEGVQSVGCHMAGVRDTALIGPVERSLNGGISVDGPRSIA